MGCRTCKKSLRPRMLKALSVPSIGNISSCCCGGGPGDGGIVTPNDCSQRCGDPTTPCATNMSHCFTVKLGSYFDEDKPCPYAFIDFQVCYFFSCVWLGPYCNCCPDPLPGQPPYRTCATCAFACHEENTTGEGTVNWTAQMEWYCPGELFWSPSSGNYYNEFGVHFTELFPALMTTKILRLMISGDAFFPFRVFYTCDAATFNCRGNNTFTKVHEENTTDMNWPATVQVNGAVPFCDAPLP